MIILTALDQVSDRIAGLNAGADDYLVKPFDLAELSARIGSVARRYAGSPSPRVTLGALQIDLTLRSITLNGRPVGLTVTVLWLAAAAVTAERVSGELEQVFNGGLKTTAERILPIVRRDLRKGRLGPGTNIAGTETGDSPSLIGRVARYGQDLSFVVRDREGRVILASNGVDTAIFPPVTQHGFRLGLRRA